MEFFMQNMHHPSPIFYFNSFGGGGASYRWSCIATIASKASVQTLQQRWRSSQWCPLFPVPYTRTADTLADLLMLGLASKHVSVLFPVDHLMMQITAFCSSTDLKGGPFFVVVHPETQSKSTCKDKDKWWNNFGITIQKLCIEFGC